VGLDSSVSDAGAIQLEVEMEEGAGRLLGSFGQTRDASWTTENNITADTTANNIAPIFLTTGANLTHLSKA